MEYFHDRLFEPVKTNKNKNRVAQKKRSGKVREGSPGGRSETAGVGFVKHVGFKPGVKIPLRSICPVFFLL